MADNKNEHVVGLLDQLEDEDFYFYCALFDEFTTSTELKDYAELAKKYAKCTNGVIKENSTYSLMFASFVAGMEKGIGLAMKVEEISIDKLHKE